MKLERDNSTAVGINENGEEEPRVKDMVILEIRRTRESYTVELLRWKGKVQGLAGR